VTYRARATEGFSLLFWDGSLSVRFDSPTSLPEGFGQILANPVLSNICDNMVILQSREGSLHVISALESVSPRTDIFHLTKHSPILPIMSMVLIKRGANQYALLAIVGEDIRRTEVRLYDIRKGDCGFTVDRVIAPPEGLSRIVNNTKPYIMWHDQSDDTILFVGGDGERFSSVQIVSLTELFSKQIGRDFTHCEPLPHPRIVGGGSCFYVASSFGELYSVNKQDVKVQLVSDKVPGNVSGPSTLTFFEEERKLFVGSLHADSVILDLGNVCSQTVVGTCTAPVLGISDHSDERAVLTVSGTGRSASLNRIMTTGLGACRITEEGQSSCLGNCDRIFLAFQDRVLLVSSPAGPVRGFSISARDGGVTLNELVMPIIPSLLGSYDFDHGTCLCITPSCVLVMSEKSLEVKETWRPPKNSTIISCDYCPETHVLLMASTDGSLHRLTKTGCSTSKYPGDELSAIAVHKHLYAVSDWSGKFSLRDASNRVVFESLVMGSVVRSIVIGPSPSRMKDSSPSASGLCSFFATTDGAVIVASEGARGWTQTGHYSIGTLPIALSFNRIGLKKFVMACCDRPSVISGDPMVTELVETSSGTVVATRDLVLCGSLGVGFYTDWNSEIQAFYMNPENLRIDQCHVQRCLLSCSNNKPDIIPVGIEAVRHVGLIAVGISGMSGEGCDSIDFFEPYHLSYVSRFMLPHSERLASITTHKNGLVFASYMDTASQSIEPRESKVSFIQATGNEWSVTGPSYPIDGAIYGVESCGDECIAVIAVRTLYILRIDVNGLIGQVSSIETDFLAVSLSVSCQVPARHCEIVVGDVSKSCSVYRLENSELTLVAKDLVPASTMATEQLGDEILLGDDLGNIYSMRVVEPSLRRLERIAGFNVNEKAITCMKRFDENNCWIGAQDGTLCLVSRTGKRIEGPVSGVRFGQVFEPRRISNPSVRNRIY
jgi:hypothetical protein